MTWTKCNWVQSVAWLIFGQFFPPDIGALFPTVPSHSVHDPQLTPEVTEWWSGCRDMLAQTLVRLFGRQGGEFFTGATSNRLTGVAQYIPCN